MLKSLKWFVSIAILCSVVVIPFAIQQHAEVIPPRDAPIVM